MQQFIALVVSIDKIMRWTLVMCSFHYLTVYKERVAPLYFLRFVGGLLRLGEFIQFLNPRVKSNEYLSYIPLSWRLQV